MGMELRRVMVRGKEGDESLIKGREANEYDPGDGGTEGGKAEGGRQPSTRGGGGATEPKRGRASAIVEHWEAADSIKKHGGTRFLIKKDL